jgi:prolyl-tRNA editing enzyme YbaK/EbsC (Cys-tRNA(Pro) deacylase)
VDKRNSRVAAAVAAAGVEPNVKILDVDAKTAVAAAAQLGCEVGAIANSLVFDCDGEPLLVMASGAHRVDTDHLARILGATAIRKANPQLVSSSTDQVIGGVAPTGHPHNCRRDVGPVSGHLDRRWHRGFGDVDDVRRAVGGHRRCGDFGALIDA